MKDAARQYGGQSAADRAAERRARFLAAGLELMGTRGTAATTVRGLAEQTGLAARYFYEGFDGIEELQLAVFEGIAAEATTAALAAIADADRADRAGGDVERGGDAEEARTRAVLGAMVDLMLADPRKGRIALIESVSSPVLGPRVLEESRRFASMLAATASSGDPLASGDLPTSLRITAQFLIGGVAHALGAVLQGDLHADRDELVDVLVQLFLSVDTGVHAQP